MTQTPPPKSNRGKYLSSPQTYSGQYPTKEILPTPHADPSRNLRRGDSQAGAKHPELSRSQQSSLGINGKTTALAMIMAMLPVLAVGTATYHFGSQSISQQITVARRLRTTNLTETELQEQKQLLATLLIGTGVTAMLAGAIAAFWVNRTLRSVVAATTAPQENRGEAQVEQREVFVDVIQRIRASLKEEDILKATVEEVRRVLGCDRVVIYSREEATRGKVIAESVAAGFPRALGATIKDPCFEARYDEQYRNGRVRALNNIHEGGMTQCYIELLEKLAVKANLVAPILNEGKLLGLLVAHQCSQPRSWQQFEINLFAQIATQVGFTFDNARLLANAANLQKQANTEAEWTQFFTDAVQHIRASLKEEDILEATVEEVRKVLGCDRVVIYSREEATRGKVISESVAAGFPRALGVTIKDPCFEARYDEQYRNGRVRALDNIYEAGMTQCYIELLEKLAVKANLVAPILNEGKLLGLLVAHQCSQPRAWQQFEIRWFAQIATQVGFALDNARLLTNATSLQKQGNTEVEWTRFFTDTVQYIRTSLNEEDVLKATVREVRRVLACDRVVIYSREEVTRGMVIAESVAPGLPKALGLTIKDPCFEARYDEQYRNGRVRALDNIYESGMTQCYIELLEKLAVKANLVAPILNEGKLLGLLVAHQCSQPRAWQQFEIRWFAQIATQVGFALDNARLLANATSLQKQANTEAEWTQLFTDTIQHIRASLNEEEILEASVEAVRKVLVCDRVVIYSREEATRGKVISESVAAGFPRALGVTIKDPCFEATYDEQYRNGRVRALDNIYEAKTAQCYIDLLEKLAVKANLVAPILYQGELLGLLVAHQCSEPRAWQQFEIRWFAQIATQVGFALENARLLRQIDKAYQIAEKTSHNQLRQKEEFQNHVSELLRYSEAVVGTFSTEAFRQSEAIASALNQIQGVVDAAMGITATVEQVKLQVQQTTETVQQGQETVKWSVDSISVMQQAVVDAAQKVKRLSQSYHKISDMVSVMNDLAQQMNNQSMNITITAGRTGHTSQESVVAIAEQVLTFTRQLVDVTSTTESLVAEIATETHEVVAAVETGTQQAIAGTQLVEETQQKLDEIANVSFQMSMLVDEIAQAVANQAETSSSANQFVMEAASFASQNSEQSRRLAESFTKLAVVAQEIQADVSSAQG